ncbi:MAG: hypothetical protein K2X37_08985 [Chitinophagaceae bacterium]|nr:hypothetical protein [Chitinophagaceae bacterium]
MKPFFVQILFFALSYTAASQQTDVDLLRIKSRMDSIKSFTANLKLSIDISFINMPAKKATMRYQKNKPIKFSSEDFVMIPKRGLDFTLNQLLAYDHITVPRGEEWRNGKKYKAINIVPTDPKADFSIALLLIDVANTRIAESEISTKKDGTYTLIFQYDKQADPLPSKVEVSFEVEKIRIPFNFMGKDTDIDRKKMRESGPKTGKIFLTVSNYVIDRIQ